MFKVTADGTAMQVKVGTGRAWFSGYWCRTDTATILDISTAPTAVNYSRVDAVVLHLNLSYRKVSIEIVEGTAGTNPAAPVLTNTDDHKYYRLANVTIAYGATSIANTNISITTGTDAAPFVKGVTETVDSLISLWNQQFNNWFDDMKNQLDSDAAGHLQNEINDVKSTFLSLTKNTEQTVAGPVSFQDDVKVTSGMFILNSDCYGATLPTTNLVEGRLFFKEADS